MGIVDVVSKVNLYHLIYRPDQKVGLVAIISFVVYFNFILIETLVCIRNYFPCIGICVCMGDANKPFTFVGPLSH